MALLKGYSGIIPRAKWAGTACWLQQRCHAMRTLAPSHPFILSPLHPSPRLSLLIGLNFNHRGTESTENTDGRVLLGWKEATEAAFGREIDSIFPVHKKDLCVFSREWDETCASVVKD